MSGTSVDGIDVAVVDIAGRGWSKKISPVALGAASFTAQVRKQILAVSNSETHVATLSRLHTVLGELYAEALMSVCEQRRVKLSSVDLIGCHGQTIFHDGAGTRFLGRKVATTLQIGDGSVVAERTGIPVVSDFRTRDVAAGGRGAPLVPYVDYFLFRHRKLGRVALNIGGIANITAIPPASKPEDVLAFDTGPGNMVIDALAARHSKGKLRFDRDGRLAAKGKVDDSLLKVLLRLPYYRQHPPKTAGREQFGREYEERLRGANLPPNDLIATATALTAASIAGGIERFVSPRMKVDELITSGGGIHNPRLMAYLAGFLPGVTIRTSDEFGIDSDAKEAIAFAILAHESWHRRPSNLPSATGAKRPVVLGKLSP
jgi:anhydro-N-acetylmuramic acid kinase